MPSRLQGTGVQIITQGTGARLQGAGVQLITQGTGARLQGSGVQYIWTPPKVALSSIINNLDTFFNPTVLVGVDLLLPRLSAGNLSNPNVKNNMPEAKFWRLYVYSTGQNTGVFSHNIAIAQIEMAETVGGPNLCVGGTPQASGVLLDDVATYGPAKAFDGSTTTHWNNKNYFSDGWIQYEFLEAKAIKQFRITPRNSYPQQFPGFIVVQYSNDGTTWTAIDFINIGSTSDTTTKSYVIQDNTSNIYNAASPRFWRVRVGDTFVVGATESYVIASQEFLINGVSQTIGDATGRPISKTTFDTNFLSKNAYDANATTNAATRHDTITPITDQYIGYIFSTGKNIEQVRLTARNILPENNLKSFSLESSFDGITWTQKGAYIDVPAWSISEVRTFDTTGVIENFSVLNSNNILYNLTPYHEIILGVLSEITSLYNNRIANDPLLLELNTQIQQENILNAFDIIGKLQLSLITENSLLLNIHDILKIEDLFGDLNRTIILEDQLRQVILENQTRNITILDAIRKIQLEEQSRDIVLIPNERNIEVHDVNRLITF